MQKLAQNLSRKSLGETDIFSLLQREPNFPVARPGRMQRQPDGRSRFLTRFLDDPVRGSLEVNHARMLLTLTTSTSTTPL